MSQEFKFYRKRDGVKDLILFVHGFTGGVSTWSNSNGNSFPELLLTDQYLLDNFDVAAYEYFTELLDLFAKSTEKFRLIKNMIRGVTHKKEKNLDINELASNLSQHIRFTLGQYDNIYIIAHSMGGLVTKAVITNELRDKGFTNIRFFASLAVPHMGTELATFGKIISSNLQIKDLNPLSKFIIQLNELWIKTNNKPVTKYFYGSYDETVVKESASSIDVSEKDVISVLEDHTSISKPESRESVTVIALIEFIDEAHKSIQLADSGYKKLEMESQYDDELFVIKMMVADIDVDSSSNAKELFLNAEFARKSLKSRHDKKQLDELYVNIRQLYRDSYDKYLAGSSDNSGLLLAEVHEKISKEDSILLKSIIPSLKVFHKKGMLHQLANNADSDIWWTKDKLLPEDKGD